ncbi:MAG TPA: peptidoglycan-associated lipoprotein Pal [Aquabacterium sp.]|uniref:peptidoglycan-associated lipoprotein Pal n=1 Tax=Aquabacterium sp. TaxID=1872578 RepID=UPI002E314C46|nr:peptidoglycan-associated lipoprotein Pal [Aquabacterium sp.]HEX5358178.1 peptidoglycan-associated lipoprotein Pal [Aquabacterium sp.]
MRPISHTVSRFLPSRALTIGAMSAAAVLLAACGSSVPLNDNANKGPAPISSATPANGANGSGIGGNGGSSSNVANVVVTPPASTNEAIDLPRVIYFDFDSNVVKEEFRPAIEGHAKRLVAAKNKKIVVEGHTDERGGREYNLALGQRRAEAVQKSLTLLGVSGDQVEAVSFGEERPAAQGSNEEAWAKNRRAEIKDR